jgi:hypothetical protein
MMSVIWILVVMALAFTVYSAASRAQFPLWPAVLMLVLVHLIGLVP